MLKNVCVWHILTHNIFFLPNIPYLYIYISWMYLYIVYIILLLYLCSYSENLKYGLVMAPSTLLGAIMKLHLLHELVCSGHHKKSKYSQNSWHSTNAMFHCLIDKKHLGVSLHVGMNFRIQIKTSTKIL